MQKFVCLLIVAGILLCDDTTAQDSDIPQYRPIESGEHTRRIWQSSRCSSQDIARLAVLAPQDTGLTTQAAPVLYWALSASTEHSIKLTILSTGERAYLEPPLLETYIDAPPQPGIYPLSLEEFGVQLASDKVYEWFLTIEINPLEPSADMVASATIKRIASPSSLTEQASQANEREQAVLYAGAGFWYDAIAAASQAIHHNSADKALRIKLLEQVGLPVVASIDLQTHEAVGTKRTMRKSPCGKS
ncbi:MAG: DUF928 domain-containing protein [Pseudomonadota bacterium]